MADSSKSTTDSHIQLDIRHMRKNGLLFPGMDGTLTWRNGKKKSGSISFNIFSDGIKLSFTHKQNDESVIQNIYFDKTSCNYGGERFWFLCPECGSRRELLYLMDKSFVCRSCGGLDYQCQHEQPIARLQRRARKIRHKLKTDWLEPDNLSSPVFLKPTGMHQKTFDRLRRKQIQLINSSGQILLDRFS